MFRQMSSIGDFVASVPADTELVLPVLNLLEAVDSQVSLTPVSLTLEATPPVDLKVTSVVLRSTKNPEVQHRIYKDAAVKLETVFDGYGRLAMVGRELTPIRFSPDHGMELVILYENGTALYSAVVIWDVENAHGGQTPGIENPDLGQNLAENFFLSARGTRSDRGNFAGSNALAHRGLPIGR